MADTYTVERSRTVEAPAERVYALIADFHEWTRWSPWEGLDPELRRTYSGAPAGRGAVYAWAGNRKAGAGRMEILTAEEPTLVEIALDFQKPFKSSNRTSFVLTPQGERTDVLWRMVGPRPLLMKVFGMFFNMEKLVGGDFERGLDRLAAAARP